MSSWILMRVEDGEIYHWEGGGDWYSPGAWDYVVDGGDVKTAIEEYPELYRLVQSGPEVFMILFLGVHLVTDEGYWNYDYGYQFPETHAECGPAAIVEHDFCPESHGLVPGEYPEPAEPTSINLG